MAEVTLCDFCKTRKANRSIKMRHKDYTWEGYIQWWGKYYDICDKCYERMIEFMTQDDGKEGK